VLGRCELVSSQQVRVAYDATSRLHICLLVPRVCTMLHVIAPDYIVRSIASCWPDLSAAADPPDPRTRRRTLESGRASRVLHYGTRPLDAVSCAPGTCTMRRVQGPTRRVRSYPFRAGRL